MTSYKVSVIIPIYNAQDTISRAIDSVINQTMGFSNIELILYDDKSTDDTREILKEYAEKYDNIVLILADENSGHPGKGRNEGIKAASADYIMFMDNDDEYLPDMCETLYDEIVKENADIVSANYLNIDGISSEIMHNAIWGGGISKNNKRIFLNEETYNFKDPVVWSKIFRKSVIVQNNVKFPEDKLWEDVYFIFMLLFYSNKIVSLDEYVGYIRHVQEDSLYHTMDYRKIKGITEVYSDLHSFYKSNEDNVNYSKLLHGGVVSPLNSFFISNILDNKKDVYELLDTVHEFEKKIDFDDSYLTPVYRIPNKLIMKRQYKLAITYLSIMRRLFRNKPLRKIYRKVNNS